MNVFVNAHERVIGYNYRNLRRGHWRSSIEMCPYKIIIIIITRTV